MSNKRRNHQIKSAKKKPIFRLYQNSLRAHQTEAERAFGLILRTILHPMRIEYETQRLFFPRPSDQTKFFLIDFYIRFPVNIAIEIDGGYHEEQSQASYDQWRQAFIESSGIKVIRYTNQQVLETPHLVSQGIQAEIKSAVEENNETIYSTDTTPHPCRESHLPKKFKAFHYPLRKEPRISSVEFPKVFANEAAIKEWASRQQDVLYLNNSAH